MNYFINDEKYSHSSDTKNLRNTAMPVWLSKLLA